MSVSLVERLAYQRLADMFDSIVDRLIPIGDRIAFRWVNDDEVGFDEQAPSAEAVYGAGHMLRVLREDVEEMAAWFHLASDGLLDE